MIIDLILDRKIQTSYSPKEFYNNVTNYGEVGYKIADALDNGENKDVKKALCDYVINNDYNTDICNYINSEKWL